MNNIEALFKKYSDMYSFEEGSPEYLIDKETFEIAVKEYISLYLNPTTVTRMEVINHNSIDEHHKLGRVFTHYDVKSCELSFQDSKRTLKIFI